MEAHDEIPRPRGRHLILTAVAAPAEAAGYGSGHGYKQYHAAPVLPARRVIRLLRRCDYRHIRHLTLYDGVYRAQARDRHGRRVNLVVDAYTGAVLAARYAY